MCNGMLRQKHAKTMCRNFPEKCAKSATLLRTIQAIRWWLWFKDDGKDCFTKPLQPSRKAPAYTGKLMKTRIKEAESWISRAKSWVRTGGAMARVPMSTSLSGFYDFLRTLGQKPVPASASSIGFLVRFRTVVLCAPGQLLRRVAGCTCECGSAAAFFHVTQGITRSLADTDEGPSGRAMLRKSPCIFDASAATRRAGVPQKGLHAGVRACCARELRDKVKGICQTNC